MTLIHTIHSDYEAVCHSNIQSSIVTAILAQTEHDSLTLCKPETEVGPISGDAATIRVFVERQAKHRPGNSGDAKRAPGAANYLYNSSHRTFPVSRSHLFSGRQPRLPRQCSPEHMPPNKRR